MKNHALLIELDNIKQTLAVLLAIVQYYQGCAIFELHHGCEVIEDDIKHKIEPCILNEKYIKNHLKSFADETIDIKKMVSTDKIEKKKWANLKKEIHRLRKQIGVVDGEYINCNSILPLHTYSIDYILSVVKIKEINMQTLALLWYVVSRVDNFNQLIISPLNTANENIIKFYEDCKKNVWRIGNTCWIKDFIQAIKSLSNDLDFMLLTQLWGETNDTALFSCADKEMFHIIKNLPENNQLLFNRAYDFYYKPVVDYRDEILLNACPYDGVYIGSYTKQ